MAVAVASRRRYRAAAFAIAVMIATSLATTAIKLALGRGRPEWQDTTDLLSSKSFPSGHASSSAALAGILIFLAWSFLRRPAARWAVTVVAVGVWVAVCLDRVLLGRHYPSDVVAGSVLGVSMVLLGIAVFDPARVRARVSGGLTSAVVAAVRAALRDAADPAVAAGQQAYMKSAMPYHGVTAPRLKQVLRPILAAYRRADRGEWEATSAQLWDGATHREERYAATALARHRTARAWQDPRRSTSTGTSW